MHAFEPQICHSSTGSLGMSQDEQSALQKTLQGFLALSSARVSSQCFTFTFFSSPLSNSLLASYFLTSALKLDGFQV